MPKAVHLMVGTAKGAFFFRSDPERRQWTIEGPLFEGWEVSNLLLDERGGSAPRIYASMSHFAHGIAIRRSDDLGETWSNLGCPAQPIESGRHLHRVWCLAPGARSEPETFYAGVDEAGLFVSRDGGESWKPLEGLNDHPTRPAWCAGHGGLSCHWVHVDPNDSRRIWAGISVGGVFRSDDGGATWRVANRGLPIVVPSEDFDDVSTCVHSIAVAPGRPDLMYQQNHGGMFRTTDGAESWERIETGLAGTFGLPIALDPRDDRRVFAAPVMVSEMIHLPIEGRLEVYVTEDGGERWQSRSDGLPAKRYYHFPLRYALAVDGLEPCGVYLGTTGGDIFFSRDVAASWQPLPGIDLLPRVLCVEAACLDS